MQKKNSTQQLKALFLGGILPVLIFAVIEDQYGTLYGLIAGMIFGVGEIFWEWKTLRKVDTLTWVGNGMILLLGGVSLLTQEGIWFKLQPALIEAGMALFLWGSVWRGNPLLTQLARKQGALPDASRLRPGVEKIMLASFRGMTLRLGIFFLLHALLATWAALYWSTSAWVMLKGVGLTVSMVVYVLAESLILRYRIASIP